MKTMAQNQTELDAEITALQTQDASLQTTLQLISVNILGQVANLQQKLTTGQDFTPEIASLKSIATDLGTMDTSAQALQAQADAAANPIIANPISGPVPPAGTTPETPIAPGSESTTSGQPANAVTLPSSVTQ
jgi:hypothetical protein